MRSSLQVSDIGNLEQCSLESRWEHSVRHASLHMRCNMLVILPCINTPENCAQAAVMLSRMNRLA